MSSRPKRDGRNAFSDTNTEIFQDRVLVEAAFNANMPFKWNATRIQVMQSHGGPANPPQQQQPNLTPSTSLNASVFTNTGGPSHQPGMGLLPKPMNVPPPQQHIQAARVGGSADFSGPRDHFGGNHQRSSSIGSGRQSSPPPPSRSGGGAGDRSGPPRSSDRPDRGAPMRKTSSHREERRRRSRSRELSRDKGRSPPPPRKRSRSPVRTRSRSPRRSSPSRSRSPRSPPRRRARTAPRYNVSVPKHSLDLVASNLSSLKQRYSHM